MEYTERPEHGPLYTERRSSYYATRCCKVSSRSYATICSKEFAIIRKGWAILIFREGGSYGCSRRFQSLLSRRWVLFDCYHHRSKWPSLMRFRTFWEDQTRIQCEHLHIDFGSTFFTAIQAKIKLTFKRFTTAIMVTMHVPIGRNKEECEKALKNERV